MARRRMLVFGVLTALLLAVTATISTPEVGAATGPSVTKSVKVVAPDAGATNFGSAFSLDAARLGVTAQLNGKRVFYVFDRSGDNWTRSATIKPGAGSTSTWGNFVAVSGTTIAIADMIGPYSTGTERYGIVHLYHFNGSVWSEFQSLTTNNDFSYFAQGVWLTGNGLIVRTAPYCDSTCSAGNWTLYQRGSNGRFAQVFNSGSTHRGAKVISVGAFNGQFVVGNPGTFDIDNGQLHDNAIMAWDTNTSPATVTLDQTTPYLAEPYGEIAHDGWYRRADISTGIIAYENCCDPEKELRILKAAGSGWAPDATFPVTGPSDWISVVPDVVLLADHNVGGWRTFVRKDGTWAAGTNINAPDATAGTFAQQPIAAGDQLGVKGNNAIWILTVSPK